MKQIIVGDLHFGKYANNQAWLESQIKYFHDDLFPVVDKYLDELDSIIFLGDIFDNRYSLNIEVGCELKDLFIELSDLCSKNPNCKIICLAGNHDFYSPVEKLLKYNAYKLLFGEEFSKVHTNINFIIDDVFYYNDKLICPWYTTENLTRFAECINKYKPSTIYCHTDVCALDNSIFDLLREFNITLFTGHIHQPSTRELSETSKLFTLGAAMPIDFNDANSLRHIYVCEGNTIIEKHANNTTMQFKTFYNDRIFTLEESDFINSNTRIFISTSKIDKARYIEAQAFIKKNYACKYKIKIMPLDDDAINENLQELSIVTNIDNFIEKNIPDYLTDKYIKIKEKIQNKDE